MENVEFNLREVFREIINRMETEGAFDRDAYNNFIDEILEEKIASGELDPDANTKNYTESLQLMWPQAEALITKSDEETGSTKITDEREQDSPKPSADRF
ncbi:MAG: hypothetical protein HY420_00540 [Candidatus Kerfeldbacteria bacterium]|nr:hypothetical protein [Candidatus Kerfeldbacteria bacterium]